MGIRNKLIPLIALFMMLFAHATAGQTLDEYLEMAGENNPGLRASYFEYYAALERVPQVGALPDPQLSFGIFLKPMERYTGNQVADITLMQMFPWFGTLGAAKDGATQMALAQYEKFRDHKAKLYYDVKEAWWNLHLIETEIEVVQKQLHLLQTIEQVGTNQIRSGNGNMSDVLRLRLEQNILTIKTENLQDRREAMVIQFNQLLNRDSQLPVNLTGNLSDHSPADASDFTLESLFEHNPQLEMYKKEQSAYKAMETTNRRMGLPMFGIGLNYGIFEPREGGESMMNGDNMLMPMVSVSIPLWRGKYRASVREAEFRQQGAIHQQLNVENSLITKFQNAVTTLAESERRIALYEEQIQLAEQILDILITNYSTGDGQFEEILRIQQQLADYRLNIAEAHRDNNMAVAFIRMLEGE